MICAILGQVGTFTLERYRQQKRRNRRLLSRMLAQNENDQVFTLEELASKGVSNPKNRRNELMARIAGFEKRSPTSWVTSASS